MSAPLRGRRATAKWGRRSAQANPTSKTVELSRVGGGDDFADAFLVEAFEALVAFEVFEVGADGAGGAEGLGLFLGDAVLLEEALDAGFVDGPAFAFGEGLPQVGEAGEGFHGLHVLFFELGLEGVEVELAL